MMLKLGHFGRKIIQYLKRFEMWCCRRMEKISWTDLVRTEEVLHRVSKEKNIIHKIKRRKANWIGHIQRWNCPLNYVIEGKIEGRIEVMGRRTIKRKQLLDDLKENKRCWRLEEEALYSTLWRLWTCHKTVYG